jgi:Skp family chaperone for outer membrane proteins
METIKYNRRQKVIVNEAEAKVAELQRDIQGLEDDLLAKRAALRSAQRALRSIHEMGDML